VRLAGSVDIASPREEVWAFLLDPVRVAGCLPGLEAMEVRGDGRFRARVRLGSGLLSARAEIEGEYSRLEPPSEATLVARGAGPGSTGEVTARLVLRPGEAGTTIVAWTAEATLTGIAAAFEGRLADGTAERALAGVFACIRARIEG
jgi:carbon monoxide dehydrogenase subunit G